MATLYITEFSQLGSVGAYSNHDIQAPAVDFINAFQTIVMTTSSAPSSATNAKTKFVKLVSDTNCWLNYGASGVTATISDDYLPANTIYYVAISPGSYIAALT